MTNKILKSKVRKTWSLVAAIFTALALVISSVLFTGFFVTNTNTKVDTGNDTVAESAESFTNGVSVQLQGYGANSYRQTGVGYGGSYTSGNNYFVVNNYNNTNTIRLNYPGSAPTVAPAGSSTLPYSETNHGPRYFKVSVQAGTYDITLVGGQGGGAAHDNGYYESGHGGYAAQMSYTLTATKPATFYIFVGSGGTDFRFASGQAPATYQQYGGANGGGDKTSSDGAASGGGATDMRLTVGESTGAYKLSPLNSNASLQSRVVVAGGGGGSNDQFSGGNSGTRYSLKGTSGTQMYRDVAGRGGGYGIVGEVDNGTGARTSNNTNNDYTTNETASVVTVGNYSIWCDRTKRVLAFTPTKTGYYRFATDSKIEYAYGSNPAYRSGGHSMKLSGPNIDTVTKDTENDTVNFEIEQFLEEGKTYYIELNTKGAVANNVCGDIIFSIVGMDKGGYDTRDANGSGTPSAQDSNTSGTLGMGGGGNASGTGGGGWYGGGGGMGSVGPGGGGSSYAPGETVTPLAGTDYNVECHDPYNVQTKLNDMGLSISNVKHNVYVGSRTNRSTPNNGYAHIKRIDTENSTLATDGIKGVQATTISEDSVSVLPFGSGALDTVSYYSNTMTLSFPSPTLANGAVTTASGYVIKRHYMLTLQTGKYQFDLYGAQGGSAKDNDYHVGGFGGHTKVTIDVLKPTTLYLYVGGAGKGRSSGSETSLGGYNGGGTSSYSWDAGGGGATDLRIVGGQWDNSESLNSRLVVAGGGGGTAAHAGNDAVRGYTNGMGGGETGGRGYRGYDTGTSYVAAATDGLGGTKTAGGVNETYPAYNGKFGIGGSPSGNSQDAVRGGGGGGGWYGGAAGALMGMGGGGSSYVTVGMKADALGTESAFRIDTSHALNQGKNGYSFDELNNVTTNFSTQSKDGYAQITYLGEAVDASGNKVDSGELEGIEVTAMGDDFEYFESESSYLSKVGNKLELAYPAQTLTPYSLLDTTGGTKGVSVRFWRVTLPAGVYKFTIAGAEGGAHGSFNSGFYRTRSGAGALITATLKLTEKTTFDIHVGGAGQVNTATLQRASNLTIGGYNGGGNSRDTSGAGGGATDVRMYTGAKVTDRTSANSYLYQSALSYYNATDSLNTRIMVAGGGGGGNDGDDATAGNNYSSSAGNASSLKGQNSHTGTATGGGLTSGTLGTGGGVGYTSGSSFSDSNDRGGGGGGYYGGGRPTTNGRAGAGGSSFIAGYNNSQANEQCAAVTYGGTVYDSTNITNVSFTGAENRSMLKDSAYNYYFMANTTSAPADTDYIPSFIGANGYATIEVLNHGPVAVSEDYEGDGVTDGCVTFDQTNTGADFVRSAETTLSTEKTININDIAVDGDNALRKVNYDVLLSNSLTDYGEFSTSDFKLYYYNKDGAIGKRYVDATDYVEAHANSSTQFVIDRIKRYPLEGVDGHSDGVLNLYVCVRDRGLDNEDQREVAATYIPFRIVVKNNEAELSNITREAADEGSGYVGGNYVSAENVVTDGVVTERIITLYEPLKANGTATKDTFLDTAFFFLDSDTEFDKVVFALDTVDITTSVYKYLNVKVPDSETKYTIDPKYNSGYDDTTSVSPLIAISPKYCDAAATQGWLTLKLNVYEMETAELNGTKVNSILPGSEKCITIRFRIADTKSVTNNATLEIKAGESTEKAIQNWLFTDADKNASNVNDEVYTIEDVIVPRFEYVGIDTVYNHTPGPMTSEGKYGGTLLSPLHSENYHYYNAVDTTKFKKVNDSGYNSLSEYYELWLAGVSADNTSYDDYALEFGAVKTNFDANMISKSTAESDDAYVKVSWESDRLKVEGLAASYDRYDDLRTSNYSSLTVGSVHATNEFSSKPLSSLGHFYVVVKYHSSYAPNEPIYIPLAISVVGDGVKKVTDGNASTQVPSTDGKSGDVKVLSPLGVLSGGVLHGTGKYLTNGTTLVDVDGALAVSENSFEADKVLSADLGRFNDLLSVDKLAARTNPNLDFLYTRERVKIYYKQTDLSPRLTSLEQGAYTQTVKSAELFGTETIDGETYWWVYGLKLTLKASTNNYYIGETVDIVSAAQPAFTRGTSNDANLKKSSIDYRVKVNSSAPVVRSAENVAVSGDKQTPVTYAVEQDKPTLRVSLEVNDVFVITPYDLVTDPDLSLQNKFSLNTGVASYNGRVYLEGGNGTTVINDVTGVDYPTAKDILKNSVLTQYNLYASDEVSAPVVQNRTLYNTLGFYDNGGAIFTSSNSGMGTSYVYADIKEAVIDTGSGTRSKAIVVSAKSRTNFEITIETSIYDDSVDGESGALVPVVYKITVINTAPEAKTDDELSNGAITRQYIQNNAFILASKAGEYFYPGSGSTKKMFPNELSLSASVLLNDRNNDSLNFLTNTSPIISIGQIDADNGSYTDGSDYVSARIENSGANLVITAKSCTQWLDEPIYVTVTSSDYFAVKQVSFRVDVINADMAPNVNNEGSDGAFAKYDDKLTEDETVGITATFNVGSWDNNSTRTSQISRSRYIVPNESVRQNLIEDGKGEAYVKALVTDEDDTQGVILTPFNTTNSTVVSATSVLQIPVVGTSTAYEPSGSNPIAVRSASNSIVAEIYYNVNGTYYPATDIVNIYAGTTTSTITSGDVKSALFTMIDGMLVFTCQDWYIDISAKGAMTSFSTVEISVRDSGNTFSTEIANRGVRTSPKEVIATGYSLFRIYYRSQSSGFVTANSYDNYGGYYALEGASTTDNADAVDDGKVYIPTSAATNVKYKKAGETEEYTTVGNADGTVDGTLELDGAFRYSGISVPADGSSVYIPFSYIALISGFDTTSQPFAAYDVQTDAETAGDMNNKYGYSPYSLKATTVTGAPDNQVLGIESALSVSDDASTWSGVNVNSNPYFEIAAAENSPTNVANLQSSKYYNSLLSSLSSDETLNHAGETNIKNYMPNKFGLVLKKKNVRSSSLNVVLKVKVASCDSPNGISASAPLVRHLVDGSAVTEEVSIRVTIENNDIKLEKSDGGVQWDSVSSTYYYPIDMTTDTSNYRLQLARKDEQYNEVGVADVNYLYYTDEDVYFDSSRNEWRGDKAFFKLASTNKLSSWADDSAYVLETESGNLVNASGSKDANPSENHNYLSVMSYLGGNINLLEGYMPNGGVYGTNFNSSHGGAVPIDQVNANGLEGYSSYFNISGTTGRYISISPSAKTLISDDALVFLVNSLDGTGNTNYADANAMYASAGDAASRQALHEAIISAYKTRNLVPTFQNENNNDIGYVKVKSAYYPLKILVYDSVSSLGLNWDSSSVTAVELRISVDNIAPKTRNDAGEYSFVIAKGETTSISVSSVIRDSEFLTDSSGSIFTRTDYLAIGERASGAASRAFEFETGDYLVSPYSYADPAHLNDVIDAPDSNIKAIEGGTVYNGGEIAAELNNSNPVTMYMPTITKGDTATVNDELINSRVYFRCNSRYANSNGDFINDFKFTLVFKDNWGETATIVFNVKISNQAPTTAVTPIVTDITMRTGDFFTVVVTPYDLFTDGGSTAYNNSNTAKAFSGNRVLALSTNAQTFGSQQNLVWDYKNITADYLTRQQFVDNTTAGGYPVGQAVNMGYLAIAQDDTAWTLRFTSVSSSDAFTYYNVNRLTYESQPTSYNNYATGITVQARKACSDYSMNFTVSDGEKTVSYTLNVTVVSQPPMAITNSDKLDSHLYLVGNDVDNGDVENGVYDYYATPADTGTDGVNRVVDGKNIRAYNTATLTIGGASRCIVSDADVDDQQNLSLLRGFGNSYFSINGENVQEVGGSYSNGYITVTPSGYIEGAYRTLTITCNAYNMSNAYETLRFYVRDPGNPVISAALLVTIRVYTLYSDVTTSAVTADGATVDQSFTVVDTATYNDPEVAATEKISNYDIVKDSAAASGAIVDADKLSGSNVSYSYALYALTDIDESGAFNTLTSGQFNDTFAKHLTASQIANGYYYADPDKRAELTTYLVGGKNYDGSEMRADVNNTLLTYVNRYVNFSISTDGIISFTPVTGTLDNPVKLYVEVTKVITRTTAIRSDAQLVSGFILNLEVKDSTPIVSETADLTFAGRAGENRLFNVFGTSDALFVDPYDYYDVVSYTFDGDYESAVAEGERLSGITAAPDWKTSTSGGKTRPRAINVTSDGSTINVEVVRRIDILSADGNYPSQVVVPFAVEAKDIGGETVTAVLLITVCNSDPTVRTGQNNTRDDGVYYDVYDTGSNYYSIDAYVNSDYADLQISLADIVNDHDGEYDIYRLSTETAKINNALVGTNYLNETNTASKPRSISYMEIIESAPHYTEIATAVVDGSIIKIKATTYDRTNTASMYMRVLDRSGKDEENDEGVIFCVTVYINNSAPQVLNENVESAAVGSENSVLTPISYNINDFVTDPNPSDAEALRIERFEAVAPQRLNTFTDETVLFRAQVDEDDSTSLVVQPNTACYGVQEMRVYVSDGEYDVFFTIKIEIVYNEQDLEAFSQINTFRAQTVIINKNVLIKALTSQEPDVPVEEPDETEGEEPTEGEEVVETSASVVKSFNPGDDFTLIGVRATQSAANYVEITPSESNANEWVIKALKTTSSAVNMVAQFSIDAFEGAENSTFEKTFSLLISTNTPPKLNEAFTSKVTVTSKGEGALVMDNRKIVFTAETLFEDAEGDIVTILSASSDVPSLVNAIVDENGNLAVTFNARGTATITLHITDVTGETIIRRITLTNEDLPSPGMWLSIVSSYEQNTSVWWACIGSGIAIILIIIAVSIIVVKRKNMREEMEALLVSELEFEDQMMKIASATDRHLQEIAGMQRTELLIGDGSQQNVQAIGSGKDELLQLDAGQNDAENVDEGNASGDDGMDEQL